MLTRLHVRGYKALRDIETTLEPLTVLVGPNGCGKTSVLESIAMVPDFVAQARDVLHVSYPFSELHSKGDPTSSMTVGLWSRDPEREVMLERLPKPTPLEDQTSDSLRVEPSSAWENLQNLSIRLLKLEAAALARPSYSPEPVPRIENDGAGLATVLASLMGEQYERFEEIQRRIRDVVPQLERIRLRRSSVSIVESRNVPVAVDKHGKEIVAERDVRREVIGNEVVFDFHHAKGVPAKHASEGTLLLLGLLTVVLTSNVSVLLLDDLDRALHPKAQQQLVTFLREMASRGVQVIATSHSPYLVLHLEYEEVRAMMLSDSGGALIGKLTEHPEYERWREDMTPSEFWTVFGEEWLAQAKAKAEGHG